MLEYIKSMLGYMLQICLKYLEKCMDTLKFYVFKQIIFSWVIARCAIFFFLIFAPKPRCHATTWLFGGGGDRFPLDPPLCLGDTLEILVECFAFGNLHSKKLCVK
jgi:hypothetical protein